MENNSNPQNQASPGNYAAMAAMMGAPEIVATAIEQNASQSQPPATPPAANPQTPPATIPPTPPTSNPQTLQANTEEQFIETPLGKIKVTPASASVNTISETKIETFEQAFTVPQVSNVFGMIIKTPQEFIEKGVPAIEKWRADSAQAGDYKNKFENLSAAFGSLDDRVKTIVNASIEGTKNGDNSWESLINTTPVLTFKDPVDKVDQALLVNTYYPGQFTPEQLSDKEDKAAQIALQASRDKYTSDKTKREQLIQSKIEKEAQRKQNVSASIQSSVSKINEKLPVAQDDGRIAEVRQLMESGEWTQLFFNQDGTWNENAAANLAMAKHGPATFDQLIGVITNKVKSEANESVVDRSVVTKVQGNGARQTVEQTAAQENKNALVGLMSAPQSHF